MNDIFLYHFNLNLYRVFPLQQLQLPPQQHLPLPLPLQQQPLQQQPLQQQPLQQQLQLQQLQLQQHQQQVLL